MSSISFWQGFNAEIDLKQLNHEAISVKGISYHTPTRLLEIFGNHTSEEILNRKSSFIDLPPESAMKSLFLPQVPGVYAPFGKGIYQPPFNWDDCDPYSIAVNFTYSTNAIYRIIKRLVDAQKIPAEKTDLMVDEICLLLSRVYSANNSEILRYTNNNINMFLIARIIEYRLGKKIFNTDVQELDTSVRALNISLGMVAENSGYSLLDQLSLAVGKGISFIEKYFHGMANSFSGSDASTVCDTSHAYT